MNSFDSPCIIIIRKAKINNGLKYGLEAASSILIRENENIDRGMSKCLDYSQPRNISTSKSSRFHTVFMADISICPLETEQIFID